MYCKQCGAKLPDYANYCPSCGAAQGGLLLEVILPAQQGGSWQDGHQAPVESVNAQAIS